MVKMLSPWLTLVASFLETPHIDRHTYLRRTSHTIGLYRENAIAIESEANDSFGGNVYYVTMQITFSIP